MYTTRSRKQAVQQEIAARAALRQGPVVPVPVPAGAPTNGAVPALLKQDMNPKTRQIEPLSYLPAAHWDD